MSRHLLQAGGFRPERLAKVLVDIVIVAHPGARKADQLPPHHVDVPTMHRIAEYAFDGVLAEKGKKQSRFDLRQLPVLFRGLQAVEALQVFHSLAIDLLRRCFPLIAELCRGILFKWPLGVAMAVSSPRSC